MHGSQLFFISQTCVEVRIPFPFNCRSNAMNIIFVTLSENCLGEPSRFTGLTQLCNLWDVLGCTVGHAGLTQSWSPVFLIYPQNLITLELCWGNCFVSDQVWVLNTLYTSGKIISSKMKADIGMSYSTLNYPTAMATHFLVCQFVALYHAPIYISKAYVSATLGIKFWQRACIWQGSIAVDSTNGWDSPATAEECRAGQVYIW